MLCITKAQRIDGDRVTKKLRFCIDLRIQDPAEVRVNRFDWRTLKAPQSANFTLHIPSGKIIRAFDHTQNRPAKEFANDPPKHERQTREQSTLAARHATWRGSCGCHEESLAISAGRRSPKKS